MPSAGGGRKYLQMEIDIETGQILNWKNPIGHRKFDAILKNGEGQVPKAIYISARCPDMFEMSVLDAKWEEITNYEGYVPSFMSNEGGDADCLQMEIDIETGEIVGWENPIGDSEFEDILKVGRIVATKISMSAFSGDGFCMSVKDKNGKYLGSYDGYLPSFMPGGGGYADFVVLNINMETGEIFRWKNPIGDSKFDKIIEGNAGNEAPKTISFSCKCSDCFSMSVFDANNNKIAGYHGYVPSFIPGKYGDYVCMTIDIETGVILDWKNPIRDPKFKAILKKYKGKH